LAGAQLQLLAEMVAAYDAYAAANGVLPLPPGYQVQRQLLHSGLMKQLAYNGVWLALAGVGLLALLGGWFLGRRRKTAG
jgi:LPXTG-motif cell wall-anchored protein